MYTSYGPRPWPSRCRRQTRVGIDHRSIPCALLAPTPPDSRAPVGVRFGQVGVCRTGPCTRQASATPAWLAPASALAVLAVNVAPGPPAKMARIVCPPAGAAQNSESSLAVHLKPGLQRGLVVDRVRVNKSLSRIRGAEALTLLLVVVCLLLCGCLAWLCAPVATRPC